MKSNLPQTLILLATLAGASCAAVAQTSINFAQQRAVRPQPPRRPPQPPPPAGTPLQFGDPLRGLSPDQRADFAAGLEEFQSIEDAASGLGPTFNNVSCVACHSSPVVGGSSGVTVTRFGLTTNGVFDPLAALGGSLLQVSAIDPGALEIVPPEANTVAHRQSTPLFGLGLIEAISDADILRNAKRPAVDGVTGRAAIITDVVSGQPRVGRFGWKNQQVVLLAFAGDAYLNEMGITNRFFPTENAPNGDTARLALYDQVADPEDTVDPATGKSDIDLAADFMRLLAPPPALPPTHITSLGRNHFVQAGCAVCHKPAMFTAPNVVPALSMKTVNLYSDLLLHDMGALGDGIAQAAAGPREFRTAPLWGLRASAPYLHDGRAATVDEAIRAHTGEAQIARDRYTRLTPQARQQLLAFLNSI